MTLDVLAGAASAKVSDALAELSGVLVALEPHEMAQDPRADLEVPIRLLTWMPGAAGSAPDPVPPGLLPRELAPTRAADPGPAIPQPVPRLEPAI